jgi:hypothetical protein
VFREGTKDTSKVGTHQTGGLASGFLLGRRTQICETMGEGVNLTVCGVTVRLVGRPGLAEDTGVAERAEELAYLDYNRGTSRALSEVLRAVEKDAYCLAKREGHTWSSPTQRSIRKDDHILVQSMASSIIPRPSPSPGTCALLS